MSEPTHGSTLPFRILLIDDDEEWLQTVQLRLNRHIPPGWKVEVRLPFEEVEEYVGWIITHRVAAVLIDLKLRDKLPKITYSGHELVALFRTNLPRLPQYYLTAHQEESHVVEDFGMVESVFTKVKFTKDIHNHAKRVVRSAMFYSQEHYLRMDRISEIARKASSGEANEDELKEVLAIANAQRPSSIPVIQSRSAILTRAEAVLEKYRHLNEEIKSDQPKDAK